MHWVTVGQATLRTPTFGSTLNEVARPAISGSNVISLPWSSTAVHWLVDGHETLATLFTGSKVASIRRAGAAADEVGLNVSCSPSGSTAVHWLTEGHDTATREGPIAAATGVFALDEAAAVSDIASAAALRATTMHRNRRPPIRGETSRAAVPPRSRVDLHLDLHPESTLISTRRPMCERSWRHSVRGSVNLAKGASEMSVLTALVAIAIIVFVVGQQVVGGALRGKRVVMLPVILTVIGVVEIASSKSHPHAIDIILLVVGAAIAIAIGLGLGAMTRLERRNGCLWAQLSTRGCGCGAG